MSLVKYGGGITQMSGSIAGNVYARNRFGNYVRARTKPVNPKSTGQMFVRNVLADLSHRWRNTLTTPQRAAWTLYANSVAMKNRLGESVYLTGFNHYIRSNTQRNIALGTYKDDGPAVLSLPETDSTFYAIGSTATQKIAVSFSVLLPWWADTSSIMQVFQGQPQLVTRNFFKGPWKYLGGVSVGEPSGKLFNSVYPIATGQKNWFYGRICRGDARLSEPFLCSTVTVA